jgi:TonB dependent receptor/CarboxypepD_reg-like domain/TonB-dependent Receptor Plug Domain
MKEVRLLFFLITWPLLALAQEKTESIDKISLVQFIKEMEDSSAYRFYYVADWIDSVAINTLAKKKSLQEVLETELKNTRIRFYIDDYKVIFTDNAPIIQGLDSTFFSAGIDTTKSNINYSFRKEDIPIDQVEKEMEDRTIEIGVKQLSPKNILALVGYVKEKKTNEAISGAQVYIENTSKGTTTNTAGFYSISIPSGAYTLVVQYTGMNREKRRILFYSDGKLDVTMEEDVISLKEVIIESERDANISSNQMGKSILDMKSIKNVPKILGENDILQVALTLPGVKSVGEGASGLNVRGGNADQNLIQMNEATIYNTSHFLGFFSVFNSDVIKTTELYKSGIPAQYGGRLSSILDIQMKDGNQNKFSGNGGIGPVTARLALEIPLVKERTSLILGGRTTYSDWILNQIPLSTLKKSRASFYDLVGRLTHKFNERNSIAISYYHSGDQFKLGNDSLFSYSNNLVSLQWRTSFNRNLHSLLSLTHSEYAYHIDYQKILQNSFDLRFGIKESNFKWDFNLYHGVHKIDFGLHTKLYNLNPGYINGKGIESLVKSDRVDDESGLESALYASDNIEITPKLSLNLGLRFSSFTALGQRTILSYNANLPRENVSVIDSNRYGKNKGIVNYAGPEYRVSTRYSLPRQSSLKFSYNRTRQYIHMLSNTVSVAPLTTWKLSDPNIKPQLGDQISFGFYKDIQSKNIEMSAEAYYKWFDNVIDYKVGSELILNKHIEQDVLQGNGKAYGIELFFRKKSGKLNGWFSYAFSRTFLRMNSKFDFEKINNGSYYPANYDKPNDVTVVMNYKFTRRYSISSNFTYSTGRPITFPVGQYFLGGGYKISYSDRNQFRIPDYIRLDVGFNIEGNHKIKKPFAGFWSISVYNILGFNNPYSIYFRSENGVINAYKLSIFAAPIPTITYNFKF